MDGGALIDGMNDAVVRRRLDALWRMESPKLLARLARITGNIDTAIEWEMPEDPAATGSGHRLPTLL